MDLKEILDTLMAGKTIKAAFNSKQALNNFKSQLCRYKRKFVDSFKQLGIGDTGIENHSLIFKQLHESSTQDNIVVEMSLIEANDYRRALAKQQQFKIISVEGDLNDDSHPVGDSNG